MNVWLVSIPWRGLKGVGIIRVRGKKGRVRTGSSHERLKLRLLSEPVLPGLRIGEGGGRNGMQRKERI